MRNLLLLVFFAASAVCASAQKVYFIYLQSDNNSSFYVKMGDKIYSSSTSGYLILPNLVDSTYNFSVGSSSSSESRFIVSLGEKDRGFLIKEFQSGLGLFDLQNLSVINAQKDESSKSVSYQKRDDPFASLLSKAANDTSLLYAVIRVNEDVAKKDELRNEGAEQSKDLSGIKTEEPITIIKDTTTTTQLQNDVALETAKSDSTTMAIESSELKKQEDITSTVAKDEIKTDTVAFIESKEQPKQTIVDTAALITQDMVAQKTNDQTTEVSTNPDALIKKSQVRKYSESSTSEGFGLVYYDLYDGRQDTIRLLIPNPPFTLKQIMDGDTLEAQKNFIHVDEIKKDEVKQPPIVVAVKTNAQSKTQCKATASNNDFFKLRKNMAAENTDEGMVDEAKKVFKSKCFTTEQIKNLSALFLTSAGKYQFFDAAYLHVSDQEKFSSLEAEIKDDYYLKRFKALIGE
jgi:hypothetical protein